MDEKKVPTLTSIIKRAIKQDSRGVGYIYRNGIELIIEKKVHNQTVEIPYFLPKKIFLPKHVGRIVVHDFESLLVLKDTYIVSFYENMYSEPITNGLLTRQYVFRLETGVHISQPIQAMNTTGKLNWYDLGAFHLCIQTNDAYFGDSSVNLPIENYSTGIDMSKGYSLIRENWRSIDYTIVK